MTHKIINSYYSTDRGWNNAYYHECDNGVWIKHELGMAMGQPEKVSFVSREQASYEMDRNNAVHGLLNALSDWDKKTPTQIVTKNAKESEFIVDYLTNALYKYNVLSDVLIEIKPFK